MYRNSLYALTASLMTLAAFSTIVAVMLIAAEAMGHVA